MSNKRKYEYKEYNSSVDVIIEDLSSHPMCLHGPTLLFSKHRSLGYYACASCRNSKDCSVHIDVEEWKREGTKMRNKKYINLIPKINKVAAWKKLNMINSSKISDRAYCEKCRMLFLLSESDTCKHGTKHTRITNITDEQLANPSTWLPALENDTVEAQYFYAKKSVDTIFGILKKNQIKNLLCIGTPTLHEVVQSSTEFKSILLDLDSRHHMFYPPDKFLWYNMFNNYLFDENDKYFLKKFIKESKDGGLCVLMDPPFGGRVEPLVQTLKELTMSYNTVHEKTDALMPVIWAFPYFAERYISKYAPEIKMHDYQVEYDNHKKFHNKKGGRKFGSPVRLFTNLPLDTVDMSNDKNYRFCDKCNCYVAKTNLHCNYCKGCPSKNGMTYKHCYMCAKCVKPSYVHCDDCGKCTLPEGHYCGLINPCRTCSECDKEHRGYDCAVIQDNASSKKGRRNA